ncbi:MAG: DNA repair protein RecO, partial [Dehalococcoidia bacterium]
STTALDMTIRSFELQLLEASGYRPQLQNCLSCDNSIRPETNHFSSKMGGVLCPDCALADGAAPVISPAALKIMRNLQSNEDSMLLASGVDDTAQREVERRIQEYIVYRLEGRLRSVEFLARLHSEGVPR